MSGTVAHDGVVDGAHAVVQSGAAPRRVGAPERLERELRRMALLQRRAAVARLRRRRGRTALRA